MKIKEGFMLRQVAGEWVIVPLGARVVEFNGIMTLTESGAEIWRLLEKGTSQKEMLEKILSEYDIDEETVTKDIQVFIDDIKRKDLLEGGE